VIVSDVRLLVNTPATINVQFEKVGTIAETVSVSAEAVRVNTTDASIGNAFGTHPTYSARASFRPSTRTSRASPIPC
jgi:hypothetical protein